MYYDLVTDRVIDLVGGMRDLRAGIIRAIGNVDQRFDEDYLRMLRAVRFAARLDFAIDPATWAAIKRGSAAIARTAAERVGEETVRIMTEGGAARGLDLLVDSGLDANPAARGRADARMRAARKFPSRGRRLHAYADRRRDAARGMHRDRRVRNPAARYRQAANAARSSATRSRSTGTPTTAR